MTIAAPTTGSLPRQRRAPRHRDAACAAELEHELPEDWSTVCTARRCDRSCSQFRGTWSALEVRA